MMNAEDYIAAYNKITSHKEFQDSKFIFEFVTQLSAIMFISTTNPAEYIEKFWESVNRKAKKLIENTDGIDDNAKRAIKIRQLRIQAIIYPEQFGFKSNEGTTASAMPDEFYEKFM